MSELLSVRDLRKTFVEGASEIQVLRGANFSLAEGERVAVVGQSGVGKSTLLHILGTLDRPTSGQILFRGKELPLDNETALCEFRNRQIPHEVAVLRCGHYSTGKTPFKYLDGWVLIRFLKRALLQS